MEKLVAVTGDTNPEIQKILNELDSAPFGKLVSKYKKLVQNYCKKFNKKLANLKVVNGDNFLRRDLFKVFDESLVHVVRNSLDHGIEADQESEFLMKGDGNITISFESSEKEVGIIVEDDGKGIDEDVILKAAIKKQMYAPPSGIKLSKQEKLDLLFYQTFLHCTQLTRFQDVEWGWMLCVPILRIMAVV